MHEAQMHQDNCFVTLTYSPERLTSASLQHRDFQLFMKRLRNRVIKQAKLSVKNLAPGRPAPAALAACKKSGVRYYMAGEYGSGNRRPHFHACIFGWKPSDGLYYKTTSSGHAIYESAELYELWDNQGFANYGDVTFESAAYISRYIMAKVTGDLADVWYIDDETGEILEPEYNRMSLKPAIGKTWLDKYINDVYPEGEILTRGQKSKSPKYYDKLYKQYDREAYDQMKAERELQAAEYAQDNTEERLRAKEQVKRAQLQSLKRIV